jgi:hypothetical protein
MRIHEILEAKPVSLGGGFSSQLKRRIDPKTLQAVADLRSYQAQAKKATPDVVPKSTRPRNADLTYSFSTVRFLILNKIVDSEIIKKWRDTGNLDYIYKISSKWIPSAIPKDVVYEIMSDPQWQEIVKNIWNQAVFAVKGNEIKKQDYNTPKLMTYPGSDKYLPQYYPKRVMQGSSFDIGGGDLKTIQYLEHQFLNKINEYLRKHGIDKTGRKMIYK